MISSIAAIVAGLSTLLGLVSGLLPNLIKYFETRQQQKHELEIIKIQIEAAKTGIQLEAEYNDGESARKHDISIVPDSPLETLRASVRPVITYLFFFLFMAIKLAAMFVMFRKGANVTEIYNAVWDTYTMAIFGSVIGFWFGSRYMDKLNSSSPNTPETKTSTIRKVFSKRKE